MASITHLRVLAVQLTRTAPLPLLHSSHTSPRPCRLQSYPALLLLLQTALPSCRLLLPLASSAAQPISRACASSPPTGRTPSLPLDLPLPPDRIAVAAAPFRTPLRTRYPDRYLLSKDDIQGPCTTQPPSHADNTKHLVFSLLWTAPNSRGFGIETTRGGASSVQLLPSPLFIPGRASPHSSTTTTPNHDDDMLSQRAVRAAATGAAARRAFSTTLAQRKHTPSLGDIEPEQHERFNSRQREFREKLAEEQKQREASAFSSSPNGSSYIRSGAGQGLGSLSTAPVAGNQAATADKEGAGRKAGPLANLIYGTKEGREMDAQIEASFSQVLARGKYVHSIVTHKVKPECVEEYVDLVGTWYPRMANKAENKVHLVGSWRTEVGDCDTFGMSPQPSPHVSPTNTPSPVHIWEYQRYQGYHASLHAIAHHPDYPEFDKKLRSLIHDKNSSLMQEFSFWPTTPPRHLGGLFELRSYTLHPGNLLEWETHWRRGLAARREVMEGVGAWFVQIGDLNTVHHLWQFADLEERKIRREKSWGIEGWADTVHKTVPLIQEMKSRILIPMPWSPVA